MANVNAILDQRMKKPSNTSKMAAMAQQSAAGNLTSFSGVFSITELSAKDKETLAEILKKYDRDHQDIQHDLESLIALTSEVKAISNQAALLHGERIKKAHHILTRYREGAFTLWLMAAYGNRQTPYNFMQYYEFYESMPKPLRPQIELMPRQAVYVLASRAGCLAKKQQIVEDYRGETKMETLALIRHLFPLSRTDKRLPPFGKKWLQELKQMQTSLKQSARSLTQEQKQQALHLLKQMRQLLESP